MGVGAELCGLPTMHHRRTSDSSQLYSPGALLGQHNAESDVMCICMLATIRWVGSSEKPGLVIVGKAVLLGDHDLLAQAVRQWRTYIREKEALERIARARR